MSRAARPRFACCAFVAGLNAWGAKRRSLSAPARVILPLTVEDVLAHGLRVIHYDWIVNPAKIAIRVRRANVDVHGSNEWAIAPARSASGHALLLSNSHLEWGDMHTYFEVQLQAPGVTSYGAVWIGFPTLRQCFTDWLGWTQTTNSPNLGDLYRLKLQDGGYVLDGKVRQFEVQKQVIRVRQKDGTLRDEPLTVRRSVHGPIVVDRDGMAIALRVSSLDRPRLFEQFWKMGLAHNLDQFQDAMRIQQLPLFNTAYADRDGHIMYLYNAAPPVRARGDYAFWAGVVPGDQSDLIWTKIHPYEDLPKVIDPPSGFVQNCNDTPWTSAYPMLLDPLKFAPYLAPPSGLTTRAQRSIRILSQPGKISFEALKEDKLSTHVELADHFVDDLVAQARQRGSDRAKQAADILEHWDRAADNASDGTFLFYRFIQRAGANFQAIGGYATPPDDHQPLSTPRGHCRSRPNRSGVDEVRRLTQREYGSLTSMGDVRFGARARRGTLDLPTLARLLTPAVFGPSIPTSNSNESLRNLRRHVLRVIEFSKPVRAEALLGYGERSRPGSKHVEDQLPLMSRKQMRPVRRARKEIEANLESRKLF
jgi:acyl-homoserine-lactone acylase